jgi:hypothetical protein
LEFWHLYVFATNALRKRALRWREMERIQNFGKDIIIILIIIGKTALFEP